MVETARTQGTVALVSDQPRRSRVSGMDRALQVIDYFYEAGVPAGAYAVAKAIGAPLSTVYAIVDDLVAKDMLSRRNDGTIWLGARLYHYGLAYARSLDFLVEATHEMHHLCASVQETVQVCGRDGDHMVVMAMADGPGHFRVASRLGTRVPLNWTASGRLLVGHLPEKERIALFQRCAKASPTGRAETTPDVLARMAKTALDDKLSIQVGESDYAVACVASPICTVEGECVAAISVVLSDQKIEQNHDLYANAVKTAARRIEIALGWRQG